MNQIGSTSIKELLNSNNQQTNTELTTEQFTENDEIVENILKELENADSDNDEELNNKDFFESPNINTNDNIQIENIEINNDMDNNNNSIGSTSIMKLTNNNNESHNMDFNNIDFDSINNNDLNSNMNLMNIDSNIDLISPDNKTIEQKNETIDILNSIDENTTIDNNIKNLKDELNTISDDSYFNQVYDILCNNKLGVLYLNTLVVFIICLLINNTVTIKHLSSIKLFLDIEGKLGNSSYLFQAITVSIIYFLILNILNNFQLV